MLKGNPLTYCIIASRLQCRYTVRAQAPASLKQGSQIHVAVFTLQFPNHNKLLNALALNKSYPFKTQPSHRIWSWVSIILRKIVTIYPNSLQYRN
jgi:hypothetical protein